MEMNRELSEIIGMFAFPGTFVEAIPYGNGHINDTYRLTFEQNGRPVYYILQRMNHKVFQKPEELMENIEGVTAWLKKKIQENGGDIYRETLNVIPSADGKAWRGDSLHRGRWEDMGDNSGRKHCFYEYVGIYGEYSH